MNVRGKGGKMNSMQSLGRTGLMVCGAGFVRKWRVRYIRMTGMVNALERCVITKCNVSTPRGIERRMYEKDIKE